MGLPRIIASPSTLTKGGMGNGGRFVLLMRARARAAPMICPRMASSTPPPRRMYSVATSARPASSITAQQPPYDMAKGKAKETDPRRGEEDDEEEDDATLALSPKPRSKRAKKTVAEKFEVSRGVASNEYQFQLAEEPISPRIHAATRPVRRPFEPNCQHIPTLHSPLIHTTAPHPCSPRTKRRHSPLTDGIRKVSRCPPIPHGQTTTGVQDRDQERNKEPARYL